MTVHLCFHGIGTCFSEREPGESRYWVGRDLFVRILDEVRGLEHVRISFDDGNRSDLTLALPALIERNQEATFFALAGRLADRASLSAADLQELRAAAMTIGTHGWDHISWRGLSAEQLRKELVDARAHLSAASGGAVTEAALPLGRYDRRLLGQLRRHGYQHVFTSDRAPAKPGAWLQPRYSIRADDTIDTVRKILRPTPKFEELRGRMVGLAKRLR